MEGARGGEEGCDEGIGGTLQAKHRFGAGREPTEDRRVLQIDVGLAEALVAPGKLFRHQRRVYIHLAVNRSAVDDAGPRDSDR